MDEFGLIEKYLAPLATDPGAFSLTDDAAVISPAPGFDLVVTKDAIVEDVHFLPDTDPYLIAKKLVRVNLSDMAAMGATPKYYLLAGVLSKKDKEVWLESFAKGLAEENDEFGISLLGGDSVTHQGGDCLSLTMFGEVPAGKALLRSGARMGDGVYVSGNIGDAALGLKILQNDIENHNTKDADYLVGKYHVPCPRVGLGNALLDYATAAIDISDGLIADLEHVCDCSGVKAVIKQGLIPLSKEASELAVFPDVVTGGDDYELLFTVSTENEVVLEKISASLGIKITKIGEIVEGEGIELLDIDGQTIDLPKKGYVHG